MTKPKIKCYTYPRRVGWSVRHTRTPHMAVYMPFTTRIAARRYKAQLKSCGLTDITLCEIIHHIPNDPKPEHAYYL